MAAVTHLGPYGGPVPALGVYATSYNKSGFASGGPAAVVAEEDSILWINDAPFEDYGLYLTALPDWLAGPEWSRSTFPVPGAVGAHIGGTLSAAPLQFRVQGRTKNIAAVTSRQAVVEGLARRLKGLLEIRTKDQPDKVLDVYLSRITPHADADIDPWINPDVLVDMDFTAPWPFRRSRYPRLLSFGSTATEIPLGDLPSGGLLIGMGAMTDPTLTLRTAGGHVRKQLGLTVTTASTDYLILDLDRRTIREVASGTETYEPEYRTSGAWFMPDPGDGFPEWSAWPTIEASAGSWLYQYYETWSL